MTMRKIVSVTNDRLARRSGAGCAPAQAPKKRSRDVARRHQLIGGGAPVPEKHSSERKLTSTCRLVTCSTSKPAPRTIGLLRGLVLFPDRV
jgi:hypothetical protein